MDVYRTALAIMLLAVASASSVGQEAGEEAEPQPPPPAESAPPPDTRPLDEIFIPSEEIAADEEVIFPVDI